MTNIKPVEKPEIKKLVLTDEQLQTLATDEVLTITQTADEKGFWEICPSVKVTVVSDNTEKSFLPSIRNVTKNRETGVKTREVIYTVA